MESRSRWVMHWSEVSVFDANASSMGIDESELMRAAGDGLAEAAARMAGGKPVLFLCGPGNNGGDGFAASCSEALSGSINTVVASHPHSKSGAAAAFRKAAEERLGAHVWPSVPDGEWGLVVDCLLGAGGSGPGSALRPPISEIAEWARSLGAPVLACDIPSGLGGPDCLVADRTITFHSLPRPGRARRNVARSSSSTSHGPKRSRTAGSATLIGSPRLASRRGRGTGGGSWLSGADHTTAHPFWPEWPQPGAGATSYTSRCPLRRPRGPDGHPA